MDETSKYLTREEHRAFKELMNSENARIDDENKRQNKRIDELENTVKQINEQAVAIERLALSMENMAKLQQSMNSVLSKQSDRLDKIEKEPADLWKKAVWVVIAFLIGAALTALFGGVI